MSKENEKLLMVKKSCKAVKTVSLILLIITICATVISVVGGIVFFVNEDKFNPMFAQAEAEGKFEVNTTLSGIKVASVTLPDPDKWTSSIPAVQQKFDENSISFIFGIYMFIIALVLVGTSIVLWLFNSVFSIILKEETPFCDSVIRRLTISLALGSVIIAFTVGWGFAVLGGLVTWAIYTIMEYGKQLQIQSDETL